MHSLLIHARTARASDPCVIFCIERIEENVWLAGYLSRSEVDRLAGLDRVIGEDERAGQEKLLLKFSSASMLFDITEYIYTRSDLTKDDHVDPYKLTWSVTSLVAHSAPDAPDVIDQAFEVVKRIVAERAAELRSTYA